MEISEQRFFVLYKITSSTSYNSSKGDFINWFTLKELAKLTKKNESTIRQVLLLLEKRKLVNKREVKSFPKERQYYIIDRFKIRPNFVLFKASYNAYSLIKDLRFKEIKKLLFFIERKGQIKWNDLEFYFNNNFVLRILYRDHTYELVDQLEKYGIIIIPRGFTESIYTLNPLGYKIIKNEFDQSINRFKEEKW